MFKVNINTCAYQDLRALPGICQVIADRIWELRKEGHIDENIFATIPGLRLTRELLNCIEFRASSGIDHGYAKLSPDENIGTYLKQAGFIDEGILHVQDYEDQGEIYDTSLQSIGTALLGPEVFSADMPTHKANPGVHAHMRLYTIFAHIAIVSYGRAKPIIVAQRVLICRITEYAILADQIIMINIQHLSGLNSK